MADSVRALASVSAASACALCGPGQGGGDMAEALDSGEAGSCPANAKPVSRWLSVQERTKATSLHDNGARVGLALGLRYRDPVEVGCADHADREHEGILLPEAGEMLYRPSAST